MAKSRSGVLVGVPLLLVACSIHKLSGLRSATVTDRPTGVVGYGPISFVDGVWWYFRDSSTSPVVTSVLVNPDLTAAGEHKLVDRVDGARTYDYTPVSTAPGPISMPSPSS